MQSQNQYFRRYFTSIFMNGTSSLDMNTFYIQIALFSARKKILLNLKFLQSHQIFKLATPLLIVKEL